MAYCTDFLFFLIAAFRFEEHETFPENSIWFPGSSEEERFAEVSVYFQSWVPPGFGTSARILVGVKHILRSSRMWVAKLHSYSNFRHFNSIVANAFNLADMDHLKPFVKLVVREPQVRRAINFNDIRLGELDFSNLDEMISRLGANFAEGNCVLMWWGWFAVSISVWWISDLKFTLSF